jgi:hypothetical protein
MRVGGMMVGQGGCAAGVRDRLGVLARKAAGREQVESPLAKSVTVLPPPISVRAQQRNGERNRGTVAKTKNIRSNS